jgi:hypothetical protein
MHKEKYMYYLQCRQQTFYLPIFLVHWLYGRKTTEFGFSMVLVVLVGVSKAAPYHHTTVVVTEVSEKGQNEHKISYVLSSFYSTSYKADTSDGLLK